MSDPDDKIRKIAAWQARPVVDKDGAVVLYDIYVDTPGSREKWIGSRRTMEQCRDAFEAYSRSLPN